MMPTPEQRAAFVAGLHKAAEVFNDERLPIPICTFLPGYVGEGSGALEFLHSAFPHFTRSDDDEFVNLVVPMNMERQLGAVTIVFYASKAVSNGNMQPIDRS